MRVLLVRMPLVVLVTKPSLPTSTTVPLTSQVILGVGEASTMQGMDAMPPATPVTCNVLDVLAKGGTEKNAEY